MGQELFLHPWDLRHPPTIPSDPGSGSGTVLSSPPPKHHEPGEDLDIQGLCSTGEGAAWAITWLSSPFLPWWQDSPAGPGPGEPLGTGGDRQGLAVCGRGMEGEGLVGPPGCWARVPGNGERGQICGEVQIGAGSILSGASGPGDRSESGVGEGFRGSSGSERGCPGPAGEICLLEGVIPGRRRGIAAPGGWGPGAGERLGEQRSRSPA